MEINKEISYLIGLFQTDGNIHETTRNRGKAIIELSIKDEDIIEKIKELIPYNYTITKRIRNNNINGHNYINKEYISIRICDMNFRNFLKNCGVPCGKKSNIIEPPLHLENLSIPDYIRGLYDGDGSLGMTSKNIPFVSFITSSDKLSNFIQNYIKDIIGKEKNTKRNKRDNVYNITIFKEDSVEFCNKIYYENCLSMKRKYDISVEIKNWKRPSTMKKVENRKIWNKIEDNFILNNSVEDSIKKLNRSKKSITTRLTRLKNNFLY